MYDFYVLDNVVVLVAVDVAVVVVVAVDVVDPNNFLISIRWF